MQFKYNKFFFIIINYYKSILKLKFLVNIMAYMM